MSLHLSHPSTWELGCKYACVSYVIKEPEPACLEKVCLVDETKHLVEHILRNQTATIWRIKEGRWRGDIK